MSYIVNGKAVKNVGLITEPSSYGLTATPENMQAGTTAVVGGKLVEGTGRAFEFASHGSVSFDVVNDENGEEKIGVLIPEKIGTNVLIVSSDSNGDHLSQDTFIINIDKNAIKIGKNVSTNTDLRVYHKDGYLCVYSVNVSNVNTILNYFEGKDNLI